MLQRLRPDSLLSRTILLIGSLLVLSLFSWLTLFAFYEREPRSKQVATRVVAVINLTKAALLAAQPEKRQALLEELSKKEGIHIYPMEAAEVALPLPETPLLRMIAHEIQTTLGTETVVVGDEIDEEALWVSFNLGPDDYWLVLPHTPINRGMPWQWIGWGILTLLLAFIGGWVVVRRINLPLRQAALGASRIGLGHFDEKLNEVGPKEISAMAKAFNIMSDNLAKMEQNRALMMAGVSHDLRTPISRLRLSVEMYVPNKIEQAAMIQDLDDMEMLTRQFLDFANADTQEQTTTTHLDLMASQLADQYERHGHRVDIVGTVGYVAIKPNAVRRALVNLIENALRYGKEPVSLHLSHDAKNIRLIVKDCGSGLPEEELEPVKRPFYRGEAARTGAKGSGLGLAVVERIAKMHGGNLKLRNHPKEGLLAEIILPVKQPRKSS